MSESQYKLLSYDKDEGLTQAYVEEMAKENFSPLQHKIIIETPMTVEGQEQLAHIVYTNVFIGNEFKENELPISFDWATFKPDGEQFILAEEERILSQQWSERILQDIIVLAMKDYISKAEEGAKG